VTSTRLVALLPCALLISACGGDELSFAPSGVSGSVNDDIVTVAEVRWSTAQPSVGYVSYGKTPSLGENTRVEAVAATSHTQSLIGLSADTLYHYRVITWDGHDAGTSPIQTLRTPPLPAEIPSFTVTGETASNDGFDEMTLLPVIGDRTVVSVVTSSGEVVWYHPVDDDRSATRAWFSRDGTSILYNALGSGAAASDSAIVRVALDGSSVDSTPLPNAGRDFLELPGGTLAALVTDERDFEGDPLRGDQIVEVAADGDTTPVWSSWDCFDPADFPGDGSNGEWTGAVALAFDDGDDDTDGDDAYYVSLRSLSTIVKVERATGDCSWVFGEADSTIELTDGSDAFQHPGGFFASAKKLIVIDSDGAGNDASRMIDYTLDLEAGTATSTRTYSPNPTLHVDDLGSVMPLTNDRVMLNWSTTGKLQVVGEMGDVLWSLSADKTATFGHHSKTDRLYLEPLDKP
jgi:hypothetical protein